MQLMKYIYGQSRPIMFLACLTAIASGLLGAAIIRGISAALATPGARLDQGLGFLALCLCLLFTRAIAALAIANLTQNAAMRLRIEISQKLLNTPHKKLQSLGKPELLVILTRDVEVFSNAVQFAPRLLADAVVVVICFAYLAWMSIPVFLLLLSVAALGSVIYRWASRRPQLMARLARSKLDILHGHFRDLIEGSRELQINRRRGTLFVNDVIKPEVMSYRSTVIRGVNGYTWANNVGDLASYLALGLLLFVLPSYRPEALGTLAASTLVVLYMLGPISTLVNSGPLLNQANVALERIRQLDAQLHAVPTRDQVSRGFETEQGFHLTLDAVCHCYADQAGDTSFTLGPLDLEITQGEVLFLIGGNGSGKTTLAMLLTGLYLPDSGTISLGGTAVTAENLALYQQHFSVVFSDFHLLRHLLVLGPAGEQGEQGQMAQYYLDKLGLGEKVSIQNSAFSTLNLSSGQRKRLALVTCYLEDRPIYVFDEWAADQDPAFKRVFYTELLPELKARGKTVIVISHDDGYYDYADRLVKLENGSIRSWTEAPKAGAGFSEKLFVG